jgi:hypothetical protein
MAVMRFPYTIGKYGLRDEHGLHDTENESWNAYGQFTYISSWKPQFPQGFLSLAFLTYPAYDFASDARGYSWGGVAELYRDDWPMRVARITPPKDPNQLPVDFRLAVALRRLPTHHDHARSLDEASVPGAPVGNEVLFGIAAGRRLTIGSRWTDVVGPEVFGEAALRSATTTTVVEGLLSARNSLAARERRNP